jgi:short subunit dehydrogenase-like uncharacterized protein
VSDRDHDIVLFGATGFTGGLTAEYLAQAPAGTRWAIAGRNQAKLEAVRRRLAEIDPASGDLALLHADVTDPASIRAVAASTRVAITTVGPYIRYGEPLVAACAAAGTDYVDLTGEPEFVDRMWLRYHEQAERSGARLVHSCGFDSIPHDLGALFTVQQLPAGVSVSLQGFVRANGTFSGGTYHSAIEAMGRLRHGARVARERRARESRPDGRRVRPAGRRVHPPAGRRVRGVLGSPHRVASVGGWVLPLPTIDPQTVLRSARALDRYGPDFTYSHYLVAKHLPVMAGLVGGVGAAMALAQLPLTRKLLLSLKDAGEGPSSGQREQNWFRIRFIGEAGGRSVLTEVSGGDPGYGETSKMLAESALCLAHDELPALSGQLTPAVAMGQPLIDRLRRAGIRFGVLEFEPSESVAGATGE